MKSPNKTATVPDNVTSGNGTPKTIDSIAKDEVQLAVRLVVGAGTHAGVAAEIRQGLYMIGRDRECQIRPKSQSVSARHCLVQHASGTVRVMDLESARGTFVNEEQLAPKSWRLLDHGDRLRCGKYWFDVAIYLRDEEDEADSIFDSNEVDLLKSESSSVSSEVPLEDLFDVETFGFENSAATTSEQKSLDREGPYQPVKRSAAAKANAKSQQSQIPKPKIKRIRSSSGRSFSLGFSGPDSWKIMFAIIAALAVISYLGWSMYQLQKGNPVKILRGID